MADDAVKASGLSALEQRIDQKLTAFKDEIIQAIGDKFTELGDRLDGITESIDHDHIRPLHDKIDFNDEKVGRNTTRIERLEERVGLTNPFPS